MDQVALIGPNDGKSLKYHVEASRKYNTLIQRTFYICAETPEISQLVQKINSENVIFIPESTLLSPQICSNKWIYQQLLKLSVDQLRNSHNLSELFLFTDVDTIAIRDVKEDLFFRDGQPIYYMRSRHAKPILCKEYQETDEALPVQQNYLDWHYAMTYSTLDLLNLKNKPELSAIDACVIWSQKTLRRLKRHIEKVNGLPWQHAIVNKWIQFLCKHQAYFQQESGFRNISFSQRKTDKVLSVEYLHSNIRLGFSEWQLYTYFNSYIEKSDKRWLGLMGKANGPHVAEFNEAASNQEVLKEVLNSKTPPSFLYFYPAIQKSEKLLNEYFNLDS